MSYMYEEEEMNAERGGFWKSIRSKLFPVIEEDEAQEEAAQSQPSVAKAMPGGRVQRFHAYYVHIRKDLHSIEDAKLAADGLKEGKQQIINLSSTPPGTRERIVDFLNGVIFALEGSAERVSEHVFVYAPPQAILDSPTSIRLKATEADQA